VDESGFSLVPCRVRTWAPRGQTPVLCHRHSWSKCSAISGITTDARLFLLIRPKSIRTHEIQVFVRHLLRHIRGNICLVWDNLNAHKSQAVKQLVHQFKRRLWVEYLPPYAPELNPDEKVWKHLKYVDLANFGPLNIQELTRAIRRSVGGLRRRPKILRGFLKGTPLFFD